MDIDPNPNPEYPPGLEPPLEPPPNPEFPPGFEPIQRHVGRQLQLRQAEVGGVRVLGEEQRVVGLAEEAGVLPGGDGAVADDVRVGDEGGDAGPGRTSQAIIRGPGLTAPRAGPRPGHPRGRCRWCRRRRSAR